LPGSWTSFWKKVAAVGAPAQLEERVDRTSDVPDAVRSNPSSMAVTGSTKVSKCPGLKSLSGIRVQLSDRSFGVVLARAQGYPVTRDGGSKEVRQGESGEVGSRSPVDATPLDPLWVSLAVTPASLPVVSEQVPSSAGAAGVVVPPAVVRRLSLGGNGRSGCARLELGGELEGGVIVVHADGAALSLELALPASESARAFEARVVSRLRARGYELEVTALG
jgi:hypothetical protein